MKLKFEMYIKKLHYYQKASCVKNLKEGFFIYCVVYFQNMDFTIAISKLLLSLINLCAI